MAIMLLLVGVANNKVKTHDINFMSFPEKGTFTTLVNSILLA